MSVEERMECDLRVDAKYIEIIAKRNNLYKRYSIKKKNGGMREILQPSKELKVLQRGLVDNIFSEFPVSEYSYAYSKGDSIKRNAIVHKNSKYILHTDIKNFFYSITREMLKNYFEKNIKIVNRIMLTEKDIELILDICLYCGEYLVVGSVASPRIANLVMYDFDLDLKEELSKSGEYIYTRYADDIVVSSSCYIEKNVLDIIEKLLKNQGLFINKDKTYYMNKSGKRKITGVVIDNNKNVLSIGRRKYKEIERMLYNFCVKGIGNNEKLLGYLSYIKSINNTQYLQLKEIYQKYDKEHRLFGK